MPSIRFSLTAMRWRSHLRRVPLRVEREAELRALFANAPVGTAVLDGEDRIVEANAALERIAQVPAGGLTGGELDALLDEDAVALLRAQLGDLRDGWRDHVEVEVRCRDADVTVGIHAAALQREADASDDRILLQAIDVSARKRREDELRHLADHDPLSGLLNRRSFELELEQHVARALRYGREGAVLLIDVDGFKSVNDTFGHRAGDELIAHVADVLRRNLRTSDTLARLGGDEFVVLLPKATRTEVEIVAAKLVEAMRVDARVTISVGGVLLDECAVLSAEGLVVHADAAMYAAKTLGRDRYVVPTLRAAKASALAA